MERFETRLRRAALEFVDDLKATLTALPVPKLAAAIAGIEKVLAVPRKASSLPKPLGPARPKAAEKPIPPGRRVQGQYIALLRKFSGRERKRIRAIANRESAAAALAEMKRLVGGTPKLTKTGGKPKRRKVSPSYYRCQHPGCTKNWFVNGRPYCGDHWKLHRKGKK